jgi:hypothetical protein
MVVVVLEELVQDLGLVMAVVAGVVVVVMLMVLPMAEVVVEEEPPLDFLEEMLLEVAEVVAVVMDQQVGLVVQI